MPSPLSSSAASLSAFHPSISANFSSQLAGPDSVLLREVGLGVQGVLLLHQRPKRLMAHEHRVEHRALVVFEVVLFEYRESFVRPEGDRSARGRHFAAEHLEEGRLPCAVGSDHAVAVARRELQIDILEQDPLAVLNFQVRNRNHLFVVVFDIRGKSTISRALFQPRAAGYGSLSIERSEDDVAELDGASFALQADESLTVRQTGGAGSEAGR